jgi:hypothetical protein
LHNEELHTLYSSQILLSRSNEGEWCGRYMWHAFHRGKPEGKRQLGRPRCIWEDGIGMDLRETGWGCVEWIQLAHDRDRWQALVYMVINLRVLAPRRLYYCCCCTYFVCPCFLFFLFWVVKSARK